MNKKLKIAIPTIAAGITMIAAMGFSRGDKHNFEAAKNLDLFNSVYKELDLFYVDTINPEKVIRFGIDAMLSQTDPYTEFYPEDDKTIKEMTSGKFGGIGSFIRYYKRRDRIAILEPTQDSPAAKAGLMAGDIIMSVGGKDMSRGDLQPHELSSKVSKALRGEPGTTCLVTVERPVGEDKYTTKTFKIKRENIKTQPVPYYNIIGRNTGYIDMTTFAVENCSRKVKDAIIDLKRRGAGSIILDLRNNGGGLLSEAVKVTNLFIPRGKKIVETRGKTKSVDNTYITEEQPLDTIIPTAVLVNGGTASASEIVSGSLQDFDRAVIIGNRTFGKGLVQTVRPLPYNCSMKVTTSKYYIPSGRCIQALDYSRRNPDGTTVRVPDSLTNIFHTAAGREVRDGGGIRPDIEIEPQKLPNIMFYLINEDIIFDFGTLYKIKHPEPKPLEEFQITNQDYADFKAFVKKQKFTYDRQSDKILNSLKEVAEFEGYMDNAKEEFAALEKKLEHNLDHDLDYFEKDIRQAIAIDIVKRYYYQKGAIYIQLKDDPELKKAEETLQNDSIYNNLLRKK